MQQLSATVARNSAAQIGAQLAIKALSFAFTVLVVRQLGAADYGQYSAVLAFGAVFVFLADLGISPYAVREVARRRWAPGGGAAVATLYGNVLALRFALAVLTAALLVGAAWLTGRPAMMVGGIALGAIGLVMYSAQGASEAVLTGFERLDLAARARVVYQVVFVLAGAAALVLGAGYYGLIVANLLGVAVLTYLCWRAVAALRVRPLRPLPRAWPALLRAGLPFGAIGLALGLSYRFDSVLLNLYRGDAETGYYNAAYNLVFSAPLLTTPGNPAHYTALSRLAARAPHLVPRVADRALRYLMALALPIAAGGWAIAGQLLWTLYGPAYAPTTPAFQIIVWVVPLMFASEFLGYLIVVEGREGRVARAVAASSALNVGLNLLVVPRFGLLGAAAMTVATEAVLVSQYAWMLRATLRRLDLGRAVVRPAVAAAAMAGLLIALPGASLLAHLLLGAGVYAGCLVALRVLGREELRLALGYLPGAARSQAALAGRDQVLEGDRR